MTAQRRLLRDCLRAGTWASLAMVPPGIGFRLLDLRIGHYGRRPLDTLLGTVPAPWLQLLLLAQHFLIGWLSVLPLALVWRRQAPALPRRLLIGTAYGALYYLLLNAWLLPRAFGDPSPFALGWSTVYPSLTVHLLFGIVAAWQLAPRQG